MIAMENGMFMPLPGCGYDDEVLNAGWAEVPEVSAGNPAPAEAHQLPNDREVDAFLARLYAAQE